MRTPLRSAPLLCCLITIQCAFAQTDAQTSPPLEDDSTATASEDPRAAAMVVRLWQRDANGDGKISESEFPGPSEMFERSDLDDDGYLNRAEAEQMARNRGRRGAGRSEMMDRRVNSQGVQVGEHIPDQQVFDLEGNAVELATLWSDKPLALVTASITCPIAVNSCPTISELRETQDDRVRFVILYVREAHPAEDEDAVPEAATVAPDQIPSGFGSHPQPTSQAERDRLAKTFATQFSEGIPLYVADIDDQLIRTLGAGPNSGLLIDTEGRLLSKLGWYHSESMQAAIDAAFESE